jgi:hypothetical protein
VGHFLAVTVNLDIITAGGDAHSITAVLLNVLLPNSVLFKVTLKFNDDFFLADDLLSLLAYR